MPRLAGNQGIKREVLLPNKKGGISKFDSGMVRKNGKGRTLRKKKPERAVFLRGKGELAGRKKERSKHRQFP